MKTSPFLEYVMYDVFEESESITYRAMMGGFTLYSKGRVFAIVDKDFLYLKGSGETEDWYLAHGSEKFWYMRDGKKAYMNYFRVPDEILEKRDEFREWVDVALSVATLPKKKK